MAYLQRIVSAMSALEPYVFLAVTVVLVITLSALFLGKEIRWGQHGYWKRKDAETQLPKPTQHAKGIRPWAQNP